MTRIVLDPDELHRFSGLAVEAADDHSARAGRLRTVEMPEMPPEVGTVVAGALGRVAADLEEVASGLYAEAMLLRIRAAVLEPALMRSLVGRMAAPPG